MTEDLLGQVEQMINGTFPVQKVTACFDELHLTTHDSDNLENQQV
jgi:hypothetical protein